MVEIGTPDFEDDMEFKRTEGAMTVCQFSPESQWNCWTVVALVMHLGNIEFGGECNSWSVHVLCTHLSLLMSPVATIFPQ